MRWDSGIWTHSVNIPTGPDFRPVSLSLRPALRDDIPPMEPYLDCHPDEIRDLNQIGEGT
jgi:hypothetical protein